MCNDLETIHSMHFYFGFALSSEAGVVWCGGPLVVCNMCAKMRMRKSCQFHFRWRFLSNFYDQNSM